MMMMHILYRHDIYDEMMMMMNDNNTRIMIGRDYGPHRNSKFSTRIRMPGNST